MVPILVESGRPSSGLVSRDAVASRWTGAKGQETENQGVKSESDCSETSTNLLCCSFDAARNGGCESGNEDGNWHRQHHKRKCGVSLAIPHASRATLASSFILLIFDYGLVFLLTACDSFSSCPSSSLSPSCPSLIRFVLHSFSSRGSQTLSPFHSFAPDLIILSSRYGIC